MIARRSLITAALGALGASATGVRASDVVKAAVGLPEPLLNEVGACPVEITRPDFWNTADKVRGQLYAEQNRLERQCSIGGGMPADIASKRSWSAVVKAGKTEKRLAEIDRALRALDNEATALPLLRKMGLLP